MKLTHLYRLVTLSGFSLISLSPLFGAPSRPGIVLCPQPDGSSVECVVRGDEFCHWYETPKGELLEPDADGFLHPASSDYRNSLTLKKTGARTAARAPFTTFPTNGQQKALVVLVDFPDRHFTYGLDNFEAMINRKGYSTYGAAGSATDYYRENSAGRFDPQFDVVGPVTLANPVAYYGGNDDANAYEMMAEACRALDGDVDFSQYDRDGDGWVDNVYLFYAGHGEADGGGVNSVWPHSGNIFNKGERLLLDGVQLGQYACSNELIGGSTVMVGIGTFCHEFGHVLGLPDLYATNGEEIDTPYYWSLMDHGNYNSNGRCPCSLTAFERLWLGWIDPMDIPEDYSGPLCLADIGENMAYRIPTTGSENEYYILENRTKSGWDAALPSSGLLIWHIDYDKSVWDANRVNNDPSRQRVDLIEASGDASPRAAASQPFPGAAGVSSFSNFKPRLSSPLSLALTEISEGNGHITMKVNEGDGVLPPVPSTAMADPDDIFCNLTLPAGEYSDSRHLLVSVKCESEGRSVAHGDYMLTPCRDSELKVEGLEPETDYTVTLRLRDGIAVSPASEEVSFRTLEPGFSFLKPTLLPAENVTSSGFTANWSPLEGAEEYLFTLTTMGESAAQNVTEPFSNPLQLSEGWESNVSTTMGVTGYYGNEAPSLRMSNNADYLESPEFSSDVTKISLWMRGYKLQGNSQLRVSGYSPEQDTWLDLAIFTDISNTQSDTKSIPVTTGGIRKVRFTMEGASSGSLCIDDITIGFGMELKEQVLTDAESCGLATQRIVTGLEKGRTYSYYVEALGNGRRSLPSDRAEVTPGDPSSAQFHPEDIGKSCIFGIDGIKATNSDTRGIYIIRTGNGQTRKILK